MQKLIWRLCGLLSLVGALTGGSLNAADNASLLPAVESAIDGSARITYFVISRQARPLQIEESGGSHSGIVTDLVLQLARDVNVPVDIVSLPFRRMLLEMKKDRSHNWMTYGSPAWRDKNSDSEQSDCLLSHPILNVTHSLVTRSDSGFTMNSVEDLFSHRIITLHGFSYPGLAHYFERGDISKLDVKNHQSAFKAVSAKRGLGFVGMDIRVAYSFATEGFDRTDFSFHDLSELIPEYPIYLSVDCAMDLNLREALDNALQTRINDGTLTTFRQRYQDRAR